jgi:adenylate kinase family enzyme
MARIAIIGNAGGGKSTLARALSQRMRAPWVSVDQLQWSPGWTPRPEAEVEGRLDEIQARPKWIIDGWGPWPQV